jgi:hypothetical protein
LSAAIDRAIGLSLAREDKPGEALKYLERATTEGQDHFDPHTLAQTKALARKLREPDRPSLVVVDLAVTPRHSAAAAESVKFLRKDGVLVVRRGRTSVAIPADDLPPDDSEIRATITFPAGDGLIQVAGVGQVEVIRHGTPEALSKSARLFPVGHLAPGPSVRVTEGHVKGRTGYQEPWDYLTRTLADPDCDAAGTPWDARRNRVSGESPRPAKVNWTTVGDAAGFWCHALGWCEPGTPERPEDVEVLDVLPCTAFREKSPGRRRGSARTAEGRE